MKCPNCSHEWQPKAASIARELAKRTSKARAEASRANGRLGGRRRRTHAQCKNCCGTGRGVQPGGAKCPGCHGSGYALLAVLILLVSMFTATAGIDDKQAIRAIIGEASNQGEDGMLAVACAIRNRGTLRGVYGARAAHVDTEPAWVWKRATEAWERSKHTDTVGGADHWENTKAFGTPAWAKSMVVTVRIRDHTFYRSTRAATRDIRPAANCNR